MPLIRMACSEVSTMMSSNRQLQRTGMDRVSRRMRPRAAAELQR